MAQDDQPPGGLLSKVVRFVRNPTLHWSELDQAEDRESLYSKHVLKEMIERKRANDFVRKREFDQLRKLRQRGAGAQPSTPVAEPEPSSSFLDSGQPGTTGQREGTLKKIDEIEAQMAQQWPQGQAPRQTDAPPQRPDASKARQFAPTVSIELSDIEARLTDFPPTDIQPIDPVREGPGAPDAEDLLPGVDWSFGGSGDGSAGLVLDPGLEEAAIRFANGDDAGAEAALQALLGDDAQLPARERAWSALFDLYRATGQQARFEAMALDFALRCQRSAPAWCSIPDLAGTGVDGLHEAPDFAWASPAVLDAAQLGALAAQLVERRVQAMQLDWSALAGIEAGAARPLAQLMTAWGGQKIRLHCVGAARLDQVLRQHTVSGQRDAPADWWRLRLAWLRVCRRPDEFDLVALDYCITYEVSPPLWEDAVCTCTADVDAPAAAAPPAPAGAAGALSGALTGDATEALAALESAAGPDGQIVVACDALVRVDFAAAGSVLNWAAAQQAAGRRVQFNGLHRLVAIFFHVIGVAEHAKILPRRH